MNHLTDTGLAILLTLCLLPSCGRSSGTARIADDAAGCARPAVITGHISNRERYPHTREVRLLIPFYGHTPERQTSPIQEDCFSFTLVPYAPRAISMPPFIDHLVVCPGDSIHIEMDFANLGYVEYSGRGAENNVLYDAFDMECYRRFWPSFHDMKYKGIYGPQKKFKHAKAFATSARRHLDYHLTRLDTFAVNRGAGPDLTALCRREIETDYFAALAQGLAGYRRYGEDTSELFRIEDVEYLFDTGYIDSHLFALSSAVVAWLFSGKEREAAARLARNPSAAVRFLKRSTRNDLLGQMLVTYYCTLLLQDKDLTHFEACRGYFDRKVTHPLLRRSVQDWYLSRKESSRYAKARSEDRHRSVATQGSSKGSVPSS